MVYIVLGYLFQGQENMICKGIAFTVEQAVFGTLTRGEGLQTLCSARCNTACEQQRAVLASGLAGSASPWLLRCLCW